MLNFVIAGRDTTAQALSWGFYMLLQHERVERKLLKEIQEHITDEIIHDSSALYEAIKNMKYAHALYVPKPMSIDFLVYSLSAVSLASTKCCAYTLRSL